MRPFDQIQGFVFVEALQGDCIDLDLQPRGGGGVDAGQNGVQIAPARHLAKLVRVERIERDVDAPDPAIRKFGGKASELRAVGRDRHFIERSGAQVSGQAMEQRHHIAPDQRLAAGDANFSRAKADESRAQSIELFERQDVPLGQEIHVLGHAVDAPIVATVGDGDAHISDRAPKWVDERRNGRRRVNIHHPRI